VIQNVTYDNIQNGKVIVSKKIISLFLTLFNDEINIREGMEYFVP
jgi:hypothetical protein